ncbi:TIGR01777 family oxidoreductase [Aureibacillus halotolerans]|uniref:TIGR01777 family protein n=1 Tax=Aureibacillus halotolerans TaxID=1508390 RepID=A0A4R6TU91_9BACI|nr:TIGR01777 family oxidoreductase [Aureibacillus halotolerans]TDQ33753.1 hypothetical protein EV213_12919 [Aureibacillus halotolerans]
MKIAIAGGSGFVGGKLVAELMKQGHHLSILTRSPESKNETEHIQYVGWMRESDTPENQLGEIDAVIHLAGTSINGRWTEARKKSIYNSRMESTKEIVRIMEQLPQPPKVFVCASAVGIYKANTGVAYTENRNELGSDFLATVCKDWEAEANKATPITRTVNARFGVVFGEEGAFPRIVLPYRLLAGGKLGSGNQVMSWIHVDDVVSMISYALYQESISGPLNVTSPHPIPMEELGRIVAKTIHRPHWFHVPSPLLKIALGDMSSLLLDSHKIMPQKAEEHGFRFLYPDAKKAVDSLL